MFLDLSAEIVYELGSLLCKKNIRIPSQASSPARGLYRRRLDGTLPLSYPLGGVSEKLQLFSHSHQLLPSHTLETFTPQKFHYQ